MHFSEKWGIKGLMIKIINAKAARLKPITIETVLDRECVMINRRAITAKCFYSILCKYFLISPNK